jgi:muramoyltetrapeptide carboxypeptidase
LQPGATIGVVAPASPLYNRGDLARASAVLQRLGFRVKPGEHVHQRHGYLAGLDQARADDFMHIWCDPDVHAVLCVRGGYGSARMLDKLDYAQLARHPKPFVGFSDITALHLALERRANLVTFYGPMIISLARPKVSSYTVEGLASALTQTEPLGFVPLNPDDPWIETINPGIAEGELAGGCLTLLAHAVGTPDQPVWRDKIVFLEDVRAEPYEIDASLTQLLRAGAFDGVAGIVLAEHAEVGPRAFQPAFPSTLSLEDVIAELIRPLGVPTIYNLPLGHGQHLATLPLGVRARLDATRGQLEIIESALSH